MPYTEPAPISPFENDAAFDYLHRCVSGVYPEAGFAPYVQNSFTDSREFNAICEHVYRFCGFEYSAEARALIHAENERIGVDVYKRGVPGEPRAAILTFRHRAGENAASGAWYFGV